MVINTNVAAQAGARMLMDSSNMLGKSLARLSSGSKLVSPEDDAAGMAVTLRFDAQMSRLSAANNNVKNAISFNQTQDGFLQKVGVALGRMSELSIMAQDITKSDDDRSLYNAEFTRLGEYVDDVATKQFNGVDLFGGATLDVTTDSDGTTYAMAGTDLTAGVYTTATASTIDTTGNAVTALTNVKAAIDQLSNDRAILGANISRLNSTSGQLVVLRENLSAAGSRIRDVDVAEESTAYARYNILVQSGTAMLAQANSMPQSVLRLLQ